LSFLRFENGSKRSASFPAALVRVVVRVPGNRGNHGLETFPGTFAAEHCPQAPGQWPDTTRGALTDD
jgi:hypothetical protein